MHQIPTATDELIYRASLGLPVSFGLRTEDDAPVMVTHNCRKCGKFFRAEDGAYRIFARTCDRCTAKLRGLLELDRMKSEVEK